jgi:DNA-binding transcriptional ArsR family regulator
MEYINRMTQLAPSFDTFNAVSDPRRRQIMDLLGHTSDRTVNDLVAALDLPQPAVSKHLGLLRKVRLVTVRKDGQHRRYALNAQELKPVHEWVQTFERFWTDHLDAIKKAAEKKARERSSPPPNAN